MRLRRAKGRSTGGWVGVLCTALGKMGLCSLSHTREWDPSPAVRATECPSSGPCPSCLGQNPVSLTCVILFMCTFLPESVKTPPEAPCPVLLLTCLLCSSHSGLAVPQAHQIGPCLRAFALAVPSAWAVLSSGISWLTPSFHLGLCQMSPFQRGLPLDTTFKIAPTSPSCISFYCLIFFIAFIQCTFVLPHPAAL